ncbi:MAG: lipoyl synthase [Thermoleophilia bacterium]|nr:lipoyl synthase [Thermoleophilia bacterium]
MARPRTVAPAKVAGESLAGHVVDLNDSAGEPVDRGRLTREQKQSISEASLRTPKPPWLKVKLPGGGRYSEVASIVRQGGLHTICEEGRCPNIGECWGKGTATFQIMGDTCTRACRYCAVITGRPEHAPDVLEPGKLANAIKQMGVKHAVITSVDRDDLDDKGAGHFATVIEVCRRVNPDTTIEVLVPDFMGHEEAGLQTIIAARPDVYSHNTETVPRLYRRLRPIGDFARAMWVLNRSKQISRELGQRPLMTKTGIIAGMGETMQELKDTLECVREQNVDVVTIGQYLRPTKKHLPVDRYVTPDEFDELHVFGMSLGFGSVFSGPLVRSSYKADEQRFAALDPTGTTKLTSGLPPRIADEQLATVGTVPEWKQ